MAPDTAVLLLVYRRPALTQRVLERLRQARPPILLAAADAPGTAADEPLCRETRDLIAREVDWPCQFITHYATEHLGCKNAVSSAIDWAFSLYERVIVLEDDCVPELSFFRFCGEMLDRYADDARIMQICGSNLAGWSPHPASYGFSRFGPIWGWATWRRAWAHYDVKMTSWPAHRDRLREFCPEPFEAAWRREVFDSVYHDRIDTWDYQWAYAKMIARGLNIVPSQHLVANIGFGPGATHTHAADDPRGKLATRDLVFPLNHPAEVTGDFQADRAYLRQVVGLPAGAWSWHGGRHLLKSWARRLGRRGL